MSAEYCLACKKFGPCVPLGLMIPSDSKLLTVSPAFGTYVAKRWSKERFSPTMTITCLMGVTVLESPVGFCGFAEPAANAGVMTGPTAMVSASNKDIIFLESV